MPLPDYHGGSIVNLMSSIAAACGGASPYAPLRGLDPAQLAAQRNLVLLLVDGLGYNWLTRNWPDSVFCRHLRQRITSVFPSTTATAITTVMTGLAPQQHGLTGWHMYFRELGTVAAVLPFRTRATDEPLARLGAACRDFLARIAGSDTTLIVIADHGFVDSPPECLTELDHHPELAAMLAQPLCGERRVAYCYVRPGCHADFEHYVTTKLGKHAMLHRSTELIARNWFGPGAPHPRLAERVGDYTLVMKDRYTLKDWLPNEKRHAHIGVHGGTSDDEMYVPLIMLAA